MNQILKTSFLEKMTSAKREIIKFIWKLAGSDAVILESSEKETQNRFTLIGCVVAFICLLCFISSYQMSSMLFENHIIVLTISFFFALLIFNLYRLLLITLAKNLLPHNSDKKSLIISLILRMIFIVFLSFIVAKPIETIIFSTHLNRKVETYKYELRQDFENQLDSFYYQRIKDAKYISDAELNKTLDEKKKAINWYKSLLKESEFLLYRVKYMTTSSPLGWALTFVVISIFLLPAWLKYRTREATYYYKEKGNIEKELILNEYDHFRQHYSSILKNITGKNISFTENYIDPPFNTVRKSNDRNILKKGNLIKWIKAQRKI